MLDTLISFGVATLLLAISPGPDNIFVITITISKGKTYGFATVLGLITGCLVHTTLLAFGVSILLKQSAQLFFIIKLFGALYMLYLAYSVYKSTSVINTTSNFVGAKSSLKLFKQGFVMNVLNPKVTLFFLAFFPRFLFSNTLNTISQFYILGFIFMALSFSVFSIFVLLANSIKTQLVNTRTGVVLKWLQIVVFVGIAFYIMA